MTRADKRGIVAGMNQIIIPDAQSVIEFVKTFPDIIQAIWEGIGLIIAQFPDAERIVLEIFNEGSGVNNADEHVLLLVIELKPSTDADADALERLETLNEVWWHKLPMPTKMRVAAHVTFR